MENAQESPFDWGDVQKNAEEQGNDEFNHYFSSIPAASFYVYLALRVHS